MSRLVYVEGAEIIFDADRVCAVLEKEFPEAPDVHVCEVFLDGMRGPIHIPVTAKELYEEIGPKRATRMTQEVD